MICRDPDRTCCHSPVACSSFGYCRYRHQIPDGGTEGRPRGLPDEETAAAWRALDDPDTEAPEDAG